MINNKNSVMNSDIFLEKNNFSYNTRIYIFLFGFKVISSSRQILSLSIYVYIYEIFLSFSIALYSIDKATFFFFEIKLHKIK